MDERISAGHHVLRIDGRPASRPNRTYGTFKVGVDIRAGETNVLPFTIWMPKLDMAHATDIPSPTTTEVVVTNPQIPGLELHLPPGTVIRDMDGKIVKQVSLTPVPTDRPPFPLPPGVDVPIFFTAQPGGAQVIPPRARVIYPNFTQDPPGSRITFWNYDPTERGWYIYGQGTVTRDGRQVIPDPGVVVYEFTGIMIGSGGGPPKKGPKPGSCAACADPVDTGTGLFVYEKTDLVIPDTMPIVLKRTYRPSDNVSRAFGIGSAQDYDMYLWTQTLGTYQQLDLILPDGGRVHYDRTSACQANNNPCTSYTDAVFESANTPSAFYKSKITWAGIGWELALGDGTVYSFGDVAPLQSVRDRYGNKITISRDNVNYLSSPNGNITKLTSTNGKWIQFTYDGFNRVIQAKDSGNQTVSYAYDSAGRLIQVTDPNNGSTFYTYDASNQMVTIKDPRGIVYLTNQYDANGRVVKQTQADGSFYQFAYVVDGSGNITQTDVTDPRGNIHRIVFNASGYKLSETYALGKPESQTITYEVQAVTNFRLSMTDHLGHKTAYAFDPNGSLTDITRLAGTPQAISSHFAYDPVTKRLSSVTDALNHTVSYAYDQAGNVTGVTNALMQPVTFGYNAAGQMNSITDALNNRTQYTYNAGDLVAVTNPLGHAVTMSVDTAGRLKSKTNGLGHTAQFTYDNLDQLLQITDPIGGNTAFTYDQNGNLLTATDALGNVTQYVYDSMDRVTSRIHALQRAVSYQYDPNGNLTLIVDRKGQATHYGYDALDRLISVAYADGSNTNYTYDGNDRLTQSVDSISGTITYTYDDLDRLIQETNPQGVVGYSYDNAGRRIGMTASGQAPVSYTYDDANQLTNIAQGSANVAIAYDAAGRRSSVTSPNGIVTHYDYDAASHVTAITYQNGATTLGNLTFTYDEVGRRIGMGGSYARLNLPPALNSANYNSLNQQIASGNRTLTYDANGNLTSDGANTFTWDARDQLVSISGAVSASFQYDATGRRTSKTIGSATTRYLYDGSNVVQEQVDTSVTNLLTGGLDELFARSDAGGTSTILSGATGSTLALTDSSGAATTSYTYDPFGNTTSDGAANGNTSQYAGRENDGTGLYFNRSRYYSPALQRFISEDSVGFVGGINLYAYANNAPISQADPQGTWPTHGPGYGFGGPVHQNSIKRVLGGILPKDEIKILQDGQVEADDMDGPDDSYKHAMTNGRKDPGDERRRANEWVRMNLEMARSLNAQGNRKEALRYLAFAIHTMQDSTSPAHYNFQRWWGGSGDYGLEWGVHCLNEDFDPGAGSHLDRATAKAYKYFTGELPVPGDFFNGLGFDVHRVF